MKTNPIKPRSLCVEKGITLIELMIVVAIIVVILSLALPVYTSYTTRMKVAEALSVTTGAKTSVSSTCINDPTIDALTNAKVGYVFTPSKYVLSITASGPCSEPVLTVVTQNTGIIPAITLTLSGSLSGARSRINWVCTSNTLNSNVPAECRT